VLFCLLFVTLAVPAGAGAAQSAKAPTGAAQKSSVKAPAKAQPGKKAQPAKAPKAAVYTPEEVKAQLDVAAMAHLDRVVRTLRPDRANKAVTRQGSGFVARYVEVDRGYLTTELAGAHAQDGAYVGIVSYVVREYECLGATRQQALDGLCTEVKSRRVREFTHYADGEWRL
jgi:hypothetical protein